MQEVTYLTFDEIIEIHDIIIKEFGGEEGISNKSNLEFTLSKMRISKDIFRKAVILLIGIIEGHVFVDGNKRTGLEAVRVFLKENNISFRIKDINTGGEFINSISEGKKSFDEVLKWLKENCD